MATFHQLPKVDIHGGIELVTQAISVENQCSFEFKLVGDVLREGLSSPNKQWFNFSVYNPTKLSKFRIINASDADSAPSCYIDYRVCLQSISTVRSNTTPNSWKRLDSTTFDGSQLIFEYVKGDEENLFHVAYFPPYSKKQHEHLLDFARKSTLCNVQIIGLSNKDEPIEIIKVSKSPEIRGKMQIWIVCRQHPSETQSEWWCQGLIERLVGEPQQGIFDSTVNSLLDACEFHIVPCMNPDGALLLEHTRTNALGRNLNREWSSPSAEAPEVACVKAAMHLTGVDFFIDVHADEAIESGAISCCAPAWTPRLLDLQHRFLIAYQDAAGDLFNAKESIPFLLTRSGGAEHAADIVDGSNDGRMDQMQDTGVDLTLASTQIGFLFDCLSLTLEQPFKSYIKEWETEVGAIKLGSTFVDALAGVVGCLRDSTES